MATAVKKTRTEVRVIPMPVTESVQVPDGGTLTLSQDEIQFLFDVTGNIGGSPFTSRRRHSDSIRDALSALGLSSTRPSDLSGAIRFDE